jgi:hypothetical protein
MLPVLLVEPYEYAQQQQQEEPVQEKVLILQGS